MARNPTGHRASSAQVLSADKGEQRKKHCSPFSDPGTGVQGGLGAEKPCHVKVSEETAAVFPPPVLVTSAAVMKHHRPRTTER